MIYKIIHSSFEIDLLDTEIDTTETNQWFENSLKVKYTLPFTIILTDELDQKLGMISHYNSRNGIRFIEVKLYRFNRSFDAKLFIERLQNRELTASLTFGFDEFPNFSKKLSELPLEHFDITEPSLQDHALNIINQTYPAVNYNFQKTKLTDDVIDTDTGQWLSFQGYLNNYDGTSFLTNDFDLSQNQPINRNIMQPLPYLLHVLITGFQDAGFTLQGDILNDPEYQHTLLNIFSKYYANVIQNSQEWRVTSDMYTNVNIIPINNFTFFQADYEETIQITESGLYKILGNAYVRKPFLTVGFIKIVFEVPNQFGDENIIYEQFVNASFDTQSEHFFDVDITLQVIDQNLPATLRMTSFNMHEFEVAGEIENNLNILDVTISKVAEFNNNDLVYQSLIQPKVINLKECVPDIKFGELIKALMKHRNYDIFIDGSTVIMNKVNNKIKEAPKQDLQKTEVKYPEIEFLEQKSYLLKFQSQPEGYGLKSIHVTNTQFFENEDNTDENTENILVNLLPLKNDEDNSINTAILHTDDIDKILISLYNGTLSSNNHSQNNLPLLLQHSYQEYYKDWFRFIILAKVFSWSNILPIEEAYSLTVYKKAYAYGLPLTLKEVITRNKDRNYCTVDFEAYSSF